MAYSEPVLLPSLLLSLTLALSVIQIEANVNVAFFSDSDSLFRGQPDAVGPKKLTTRALAAASAATLGLPSPRTTDRSIAAQVNSVLAPMPFDRASWMLMLLVEGAPARPGDWLATSFSNHKEGSAGGRVLKLAQFRELVEGAEGGGVEGNKGLLRRLQEEMGVVHGEARNALRTYPGQGWSMPAAASQDMEHLRDLFQASGAGQRQHPAAPTLVAVRVSLRGSAAASGESDEGTAAMELVSDVMGSILDAAKQGGPVAVALVLEGSDHGEEQGSAGGEGAPWGALLPELAEEGGRQHAGLRRVLEETVGGEEEEEEPLTPEEVVQATLNFVTVLLLLTGLALSLWLMCAMPITRDTLLYSGAKID